MAKWKLPKWPGEQWLNIQIRRFSSNSGLGCISSIIQSIILVVVVHFVELTAAKNTARCKCSKPTCIVFNIGHLLKEVASRVQHFHPLTHLLAAHITRITRSKVELQPCMLRPHECQLPRWHLNTYLSLFPLTQHYSIYQPNTTLRINRTGSMPKLDQRNEENKTEIDDALF